MTFMFKNLFIAAILLMTCVTLPAAASTPMPPTAPRDYVTDLAGVVHDDAKVRLNALLRELEQKTTAQVLVLTVQSLDGQSIEEFALTTKETWKLGQKGKDNGVLIVVAVNDRKYRLEIGYGLESVLPDSLVGTIGREYLVPYFRKGDYSGGIYSGTIAVAGIIAGQEGVALAGGQPAGRRDSITRLPLTFMQKVLFGLFILVIGILCITNPRQCLLLLLVAQMGGGRGGWSGGGGGFGGGSFGGGGGGRGGGGGASGGW
jgi:uncharacterized protein